MKKIKMIDYYSYFRLPIHFSKGLQKSNSMGQYDPMNYVVQYESEILSSLRKFKRSNLDKLNIRANNTLGLALSTSLHEAVHWWQNIGTTSGLIISLCIPIQTLLILDDLKNLVYTNSLIKKPIINNFINLLESKSFNPKIEHIRISKTWIDLEFAHYLLYNPSKSSVKITKNPLYIAEVQALGFLLSYFSSILIANFGFDQNLYPENNLWNCEKFLSLRDENDNSISYIYRKFDQLGMYDIMEGQARLQELQLLRIFSNYQYSWNEFLSFGLMNEVYFKAFNTFIELSGLSYPKHPLTETVNLFLLLCDIALNPSIGYPFDFYEELNDQEKFLNSYSPGRRFIQSALIVRELPGISKHLILPDKESYLYVSSSICGKLGWRTPNEVLSRIIELNINNENSKIFDRGHFSWEESLKNISLRLFYYFHCKISEDKLKYPEFFCWPSIYIYNPNVRKNIQDDKLADLTNKHHPIFVSDSYDGEAKVIIDYFDKESVVRLAQTFFEEQGVHDLVRQWLASKGNFRFNFSWLKNNCSQNEKQLIIEYYKKVFENEFNCKITDLPISDL